MFYFLCPRGNNHFDVLFQRIGPVLLPSNDGKNVIREGKIGVKVVCFPPVSAPFPLENNLIKVLLPICTLVWRVNKYVSRQGKV